MSATGPTVWVGLDVVAQNLVVHVRPLGQDFTVANTPRGTPAVPGGAAGASRNPRLTTDSTA